MEDASAGSSPDDYPTIDPTSFDVVLCGTGLPESILAAACAAAGKTVLHVDPNPFYGSLFSSIPLPSLPSFLSPDSSILSTATSLPSSSHTVIDLQHRSLYSEIETSGTVPEPSRRFTVDLVGPRVLYCADEAVDLLLRSGGSNHVEFKSVEGGSLLYWDGVLYPVPDSRQAIFKDTTLQLKEKNLLFRFFKLVQSHIAASSSGDKEGEDEAFGKISEEDLDLPFIEYLKKQRLPPKMRAVVLYAIAMADYDQDGADSFQKLLTTRDGVKTISLYSSSIGRFANAEGAFIYPMYGHGELPQAFVVLLLLRVHYIILSLLQSYCNLSLDNYDVLDQGSIQVLRMPVTALLMDKEKKNYIGTRLASGQDILCHQLILGPSYKIPSLDMPSDASDSSFPIKVARGICIISRSVKQGSSNVLVVLPPKSLQEQQVAAVRVLQLSSNVAICPPEMFIAYLSTPCADIFVGKQCIKKAIEVLFNTRTSYGSEGHSETTSEDNEDAKPVLIWNCVYVQEITQAASGTVLSCPMPDENLDYRNIMESTKKLFSDTYPNEEFLPRNSAPKYADDDNSDSAVKYFL